MGALVTIEVEADEVEDFFAELGTRATAPGPLLGFIGQDMIRKFQANIVKESGGTDFPAWAPLKPATVAERERLGYGGPHPILQRERDLFSHLTFAVAGETVEAGLDGSLVYPLFHDLGEGQAQRAFVWIDDPRVEGWLEVLAQFLVEGTPIPTPGGPE